MPHSHRALLLSIMLMLSMRAFASQSGAGEGSEMKQASEAGRWCVHAGYVFRNLGSLRATTESLALAAGLPLLVSPEQGMNAKAGAAQGFADRFYDDGYVRPDGVTATSGDTVFFGFDSSSQIVGNSLLMHASGVSRTEFDEDVERSPGASSVVLANGGVIGVSYELPFRGTNWFAGADFNVEVLALNDRVEHRSFRAVQRSRTFRGSITDAYDTGGALLPAAPYQGQLSSPGPVVGASPARSSIEHLDKSESAVLFDQVQDSLHATLTTLSLGPTLRYESKMWSASASAGLALNVLSWRAASEQTLFGSANGKTASELASWHAQRAGVDVLPGIFIQTAVSRSLSNCWEASLALRYDWSRDWRALVGASELRLELQGVSILLEAVYRF